MAFVITRNPRSWWPVTVPGVTDAGDPLEQSFRMRFRLLDEDAALEIDREISGLGAREDVDQLKPSEVTADVIMKIAEDWSDVEIEQEGGDKVSLPFNRDNVALVMKAPNVFASTMRAYRECRSGARKGH